MKKISFFLVVYMLFNIFVYTKDVSTSSLDEYIRDHNEHVTEGHICTGAGVQITFFQSLFKQNPQIKKIGEVGFNAGHSSEIFLMANPSTQVVSFDIMQHSYAQVGKEYIDLKYPGRHSLIKGNSLTSIREFFQKNKNLTFDLIFIDGGHDFYVALNDIVNMRNLASSSTLLIVDDTKYKSVLDAWEKCLKDGYVKEIKRYSIEKKAWVVGQYCFP